MAAVADAYMQSVWMDQSKVEDAEYKYQEYLVRQKTGGKPEAAAGGGGSHGVAQQIADAREKIQQTLKSTQSSAPAQSSDDVRDKISLLEKENSDMRQKIESLTNRLGSLESRISSLESGKAAPKADAPEKPQEQVKEEKPQVKEEESDSDDDLFGSDDEDDEEADRIREERLAAYAEKKKKKPGPIAKSNIILDIKPWDDETDMAKLEECVRTIETDGLLWGTSRLVDVAFGIKKLAISCVVEDDKVGTDFLEEHITAFEDYVQSVDVAAFNKI